MNDTNVWNDPMVKGPLNGASARIVIGQKDRRPLANIRSFLLHVGFKSVLLYDRGQVYKGKRGSFWILAMNRRDDVSTFLTVLEPYLIQKRQKARLVLEKIETIQRISSERFSRATTLRARGMAWWKIARTLKVSWASLKNHLQAQGIKIKSECSQAEISNRSRSSARERGLCIQCFQPRGINGTATHCRICADKRNKRKSQRRLNGTHPAPSQPVGGLLEVPPTLPPP